MKRIIKKELNGLYVLRSTYLAICTSIQPLTNDSSWGWFGILTPKSREFIHCKWNEVERPTPEFLAKLSKSQRHAAIKKVFVLHDIEKKYL